MTLFSKKGTVLSNFAKAGNFVSHTPTAYGAGSPKRALLIEMVLRGASFVVLAVGLVTGGACHLPDKASALDSSATAHYLANAGVLITHDDTKVVFDPLFRNDFGTYQLLPEVLERALFAGEAPFDGLDAVLISHYHEDHFSAVDVLRLLLERPELHLYAPAQAVTEMRSRARPGTSLAEALSSVMIAAGGSSHDR